MRLRQRRSGKVASGKRAARGTGTSENEKGARQRRAEYQECRYLPAPVRGAINWGDGSSGRALRTCHWLPSFRACRREFVLVITFSVGKLYHYHSRLDSYLRCALSSAVH